MPWDAATAFAYALNPVGFAMNFGDITKPDPWQAKVLRSSSKRILLNVARQGGKSQTFACLASHRTIFRRNHMTLIVSRSQRQSAEVFRKVKTIFRNLLLSMPEDSDDEVGYRNAKGELIPVDRQLSLEFANGSRIVSVPSSPDTIRGFSKVDLLIEDEAALCKDVVYHAITPMLAMSDGTLVLGSTPFGKRGHFYKAWLRATGDKSKVTEEVDAREPGGSSRESFEEEYRWEFYRYAATENPRYKRAFLREQFEEMGEWWFLQEYGCTFQEAVDQIFSTSTVEAAMSADVLPIFPESWAPAMPEIPGVTDEPEPDDSMIVDDGEAPLLSPRPPR